MSAPRPNSLEESVASWRTNATFWDNSIGQDGNKYWKRLQKPSLERMVPFQSEETRVLELATGNGLVARWLASKGASVLATDIIPEMLELAAHREMPELKGKISYSLLDVTSSEALDALAQENVTKTGGFDVVIMNMAIMDIPTIEPLAAALPKLLKKDGVFVATLLHPVFFTCDPTRSIQIVEGGPDGPKIIRAKTIEKYLDVPPYYGVAMYGQPAQQSYYHRPLHELFSTFFKAGLVMDAMEEPAFAPEDAVPEKFESHANYTQLPAILAFRMRRVV